MRHMLPVVLRRPDPRGPWVLRGIGQRKGRGQGAVSARALLRDLLGQQGVVPGGIECGFMEDQTRALSMAQAVAPFAVLGGETCGAWRAQIEVGQCLTGDERAVAMAGEAIGLVCAGGIGQPDATGQGLGQCAEKGFAVRIG